MDITFLIKLWEDLAQSIYGLVELPNTTLGKLLFCLALRWKIVPQEKNMWEREREGQKEIFKPKGVK